MKEYTKTCLQCGKQFITTNFRIKYCSEECRLYGDNTCRICGKLILKGKKTCSKECESKYRSQNNPFRCDEVKKKIKNTCLEKYGVENPSQSKQVINKIQSKRSSKLGLIKDKMKKTNLERYGVEYPAQNNFIKEKQKQTSLSKYGVIGYNNRKKYKETCIDKYGEDNPFKAKEVKDKIKQSVQEKYGVDYYTQSNEFLDKAKQTNLEKYGVEFASQSTIVKEKAKETSLEHFGVDHPMKSDIVKQKILDKLPESLHKQYETKKINNSFNISQPEEVYYKKLLDQYPKEDIIRQYQDSRYPFSCDFYIKSEDLFIECNFSWTHGLHAFDETNKDDILRKEFLEQKAKESDYYKNALYTWTDLDVRKARIAKENNLNYKVIYSLDEDKLLSRIEEFEKLLQDNQLSYEKNQHVQDKFYQFKVKNILIHFRSLYDNTNHLLKDYRVFEIFPWDDLQKIVNILKDRKTIGARKCAIKEVSLKETKEFLNKNHLQGYAKDQIRLGLYYNNELVSIMTFGKPRYNKNYEYELIRYCSIWNVLGGSNKLFKAFVDRCNPKSIISYCDNSKFSGQVYNDLGFTHKETNTPSKHWYNEFEENHITDNLLRQRGFDQLFGTNYGKGASNEELMLQYSYRSLLDDGQDIYFKLC